MAVGNTFGATALSSYGGFWISFAIILTPGFAIESELIAAGTNGSHAVFLNSFGLFLMGWFIFTFLLLLCTLRSTVAFFSLFFTLDIAFLMLGIGYLQNDGAEPQSACIVAGGAFGLMAAFLAWYNALAGIADSSNRFVAPLDSCHITSGIFSRLQIRMLIPYNAVSSSSPSRTSHGVTKAVRIGPRSTTLLRARGSTRPRPRIPV